MNVRILVLLVLAGTLVSLGVRPAQAAVAPITAVDSFFVALDAGDHAAAVATFTPDGVATLARGETYQGSEEILDMVELLAAPGRYHNIVQSHTTGDKVGVLVHIYDRGVRWGEAKIMFEVQEGKLHTFREQEIRVRFR